MCTIAEFHAAELRENPLIIRIKDSFKNLDGLAYMYRMEISTAYLTQFETEPGPIDNGSEILTQLVVINVR